MKLKGEILNDYTQDVKENIYEQIKEYLKDTNLYQEFGYRKKLAPLAKNIAAKLTDAEYTDGKMYVTAEVTEGTPFGIVVKELINKPDVNLYMHCMIYEIKGMDDWQFFGVDIVADANNNEPIKVIEA